MPVDRTLAEDLSENIVTIYQDLETRLAADLARRLASGMDSPTWAEDKLRGLGTLRQFAQNLIGRLNGGLADEVAQATILAHIRGGAAAMDDLARAQSTHPEWLRLAEISSPNDRLRAMIERRQAGAAAQLAQARRAIPGADAIARLAFSLTTALRGTHLRIMRWQLDSYREVIAAGSAPDVLAGLATRRRASQIAWERLLTQGITGFVDRSGRAWNLASYVEMAARSTVAQAAVEGHLDRLSAAGLDLVIVSNAPQECARCRPWEGKILARSGPAGRRTIQVEHATRDGVMVNVEIAGTVAEAIAAGLMHPNCRHSLSGYMPGVTRIPTHTEDPEGDKARQRLRALERRVRSEKLKAETALDPAAKKAHNAKVRAAQAEIRDHVEATGLIRQPHREQIDLGHRPPPGPVDTTPPSPQPTPTPAPSAVRKATPTKAAPPPPEETRAPAAKATSAKKAAPAKATPPAPTPAAPAAPQPPTSASTAPPISGSAALNVPPARLRIRIQNPEANVLQQREIGTLEWRGGRPAEFSPAEADRLSEIMWDYMQEVGGVDPFDLRAGNTDARNLIDRLMRSSILPEPIQVWRGINQPRLLFGDRVDGSLVGVTASDPSVMSTSTARSVATRYATSSDTGTGGVPEPIVMRFTAQPGVGAVSLGDDDREILLQRGARLTVTADRRERGMRILDVLVHL
ncbi:phage minor capsid protein [Dactylosporangium sp. NPDC000521]|uniref:phage minor capsid protein n=1 Tax=Dactylosporangium sp. NPDC000521 TaxID=3363975 RepID=UPI00368AF670